MKRIYSIAIISLAVLIFYMFIRLVPYIYFSIGKSAYLEKDYAKAYPMFKTAVYLNRKDRDYRYYYVQTLIKLNPTLEIQKELFAISQENLPDSADLIADNQIETWKQQIFLSIGENYIEQVPFNNKILRWDVKKFPLKVAFENDSSAALPDYYRLAVVRAFLQWQSSTNNLIKFAFVDNDKDAEILIKIVPSADMSKCNQEDCKYVVAYTTPGINGDFLKKMTITFYDLNNIGQPFSEKEIFNTALHEIGHSLGIMGHSYNKDDLMYMENNLDKNYDVYRSDFQSISSIDMNTIELLYKLIPDITNTSSNEFDTSNQFFAPIVMGSGELVNSRKLLEAQNYIQGAPNIPNGYIDLASAYAEQKQYGKAIQSLEKALELSSNDSEKYMVYYNFAVVYINLKDWENALKYATVAKDVQKSDSADIDGMMAYIEFNRKNKQKAKILYQQALEEDPQNITNALNLARIYIKEFNFSKAGHVLNRLVKANPQAKNDPGIIIYTPIMMLFK